MKDARTNWLHEKERVDSSLKKEDKDENYNKAHDRLGRFAATTGGPQPWRTIHGNKITRSVTNMPHAIEVEFKIKNDKMIAASRARLYTQDGVLGIKKGDVFVNTSASGDLTYKQSKAFHEMVGSANLEAANLEVRAIKTGLIPV